MNLSSLSNEDLKILMDAVLNTDDNPAADAVAGAVIQEQANRQGVHDIQTGYQIQVLEFGKWKTLDRSAVSAAVFSRFYSTKENAQKAMDRINAGIKDRRFEYRTVQYKKAEYRFVQVMTITKIV